MLFHNFIADHLHRSARTSDLRLTRLLHALLLKTLDPPPLPLLNRLLHAYLSSASLPSARRLFLSLPSPNLVSFSVTISGLARSDPASALALFSGMGRVGIRPNEFVLVGALKACGGGGPEDVGRAFGVYAVVVKLGFGRNVFLGNAFLTALGRAGELKCAIQFFQNFDRPDVVTWNAMLAGFLQHSCEDVWEFWCRMGKQGPRPDEFSFSSVLTGLARVGGLERGMGVHGQLVKCGSVAEMCVGDSLLDMYLSNHVFPDAWKVFEEMPKKDVVSWTQIIFGCLQCGRPSEALQLWKVMMRKGVVPNKFTLASIFNVCVTLVCLEEGKKIHGLRVKLGKDAIDVCVDNALLDMYAKCGCMDAANVVFRQMNERSVVSWTTMIMGFAQNGFAKEALKVFDDMISESVEPNSITFVCVLFACSQGGMVEKGWNYFSSMNRDFGIVPEEDHYICMVDMLGRTGKIADAETLIRSMPFQPGPLVWQTLLGACRIHGDVETGERAAEKALAQDKEDHSTYVLLSNMLATSKRWDGVGKVRKMLEDGGIERIHGRSWTEVAHNHANVHL